MKNLNKASSTQIILVFCLGVFGILSTELGMMGIIPIVSQNFSVSISDAGWCASIFALVITFAPLLSRCFVQISILKNLCLFV